MISLSETAINSTHDIYNIPNYNIEINYIDKKTWQRSKLIIIFMILYNIRREKIYKWMDMLIPYS